MLLLVLWISPNIGYWAGVGPAAVVRVRGGGDGGEVGGGAGAAGQGPGVGQGHQLRRVGGAGRDNGGPAAYPGTLIVITYNQNSESGFRTPITKIPCPPNLDTQKRNFHDLDPEKRDY